MSWIITGFVLITSNDYTAPRCDNSWRYLWIHFHRCRRSRYRRSHGWRDLPFHGDCDTLFSGTRRCARSAANVAYMEAKIRDESLVSKDVADAWVFVERNVINQQPCTARYIHAFRECNESISIARSSGNIPIDYARFRDRKEQCHSIVGVSSQRDMQSLPSGSVSEWGLRIEIERQFIDRYGVIPSVRNSKRSGEVRPFLIYDIRTDSGGEAPLFRVL